MPKYLIREDGAVFPYSPGLATDARFKTVDELPESHLRGIERARGRTDTSLAAARAMREAQDRRLASRREAADAVRARVSNGPAADPAAAAEAQRQANEFAGAGSALVTNPAAPAAPAAPQFVIAAADKPALLEFMKANFPAEKVHPNTGVEKLRQKVAELTGVKPE